MDLNDVTPENFFKKCTNISDPTPGNKLVLSNESFVQCAIQLRLIQTIEILRQALK